jgi:tRNA A37 threonylcarbamoyladenosine dehydratase
MPHKSNRPRSSLLDTIADSTRQKQVRKQPKLSFRSFPKIRLGLVVMFSGEEAAGEEAAGEEAAGEEAAGEEAAGEEAAGDPNSFS